MSNKLTTREKEVKELIFKGLSNQNIADELSLSINTIKTHVSKILQKTGARTRVELITNKIKDHQ